MPNPIRITDGTDNLAITSAGEALFTVTAASTDVNADVDADVDAAVAALAGLRLMGYAVRETAGGAASLNIVEGAVAATGDLVWPITLAANGVEGMWFGPDGIEVPAGLSIDRVSGTTTVVLFHKASYVASGATIPTGYWTDPFVFGSAYIWYDTVEASLRINHSAAPTSISDGNLLTEAT